jgi:peptide/nickel transport system ATP-binding protein
MNQPPESNVLEVKDLKKWFPLRQGMLQALLARGSGRCLKAVDGVSFSIRPGEVLGLVGESGCGKTTTGMTVIRLYEPTSGQIFFSGKDIARITGREKLRAFRKSVQIVFQNPYESLNPRFTVLESIDEPVRIHYPGSKSDRYERVVRSLENAGLVPPEYYLDRYPHELSGGQLQRVAIARAIAVGPSFLVADEPVSMLDVSIRAGILNLLKRLAGQFNLGILYISHDLSTMKHVCTGIGVMYLGRIVEIGSPREILGNPKHPYTRALVAAVPLMGARHQRERILLEGAVPNPIDLPPGCRFHSRCPVVRPICTEREPDLTPMEQGRQVACHLFK